jgi:transcriptional regulator with XRE-family HTH domain
MPVNNSDLKDLGQRIRTRRKSLVLTQEELADLAEIDRSYLGGIERGERNITFNLLCQLCRVLKCDVAALTEDLPHIPQ